MESFFFPPVEPCCAPFSGCLFFVQFFFRVFPLTATLLYWWRTSNLPQVRTLRGVFAMMYFPLFPWVPKRALKIYVLLWFSYRTLRFDLFIFSFSPPASLRFSYSSSFFCQKGSDEPYSSFMSFEFLLHNSPFLITCFCPPPSRSLLCWFH